MTYLLLSACSPVTLHLNDGPPDRPGPVGDTAADTGTAGDTETGGDTDTGTRPVDAGAYTGTVHGVYASAYGSDYECDGGCSLRLTPSGELSGDASCSYGGGSDYDLDGTVTGSADDGAVSATWTVYFDWNAYDYDLTGEVADGAMVLSLSLEYGDGSTFTAEMDATR